MHAEHEPLDRRGVLPVLGEVDFSLYITNLPSGDVPPIWLRFFLNWLRAAAIAGIASLERGKKKNNLHIQGLIRMRPDYVERTEKAMQTYCLKLKRQMKAALCVIEGFCGAFWKTFYLEASLKRRSR